MSVTKKDIAILTFPMDPDDENSEICKEAGLILRTRQLVSPLKMSDEHQELQDAAMRAEIINHIYGDLRTPFAKLLGFAKRKANPHDEGEIEYVEFLRYQITDILHGDGND